MNIRFQDQDKTVWLEFDELEAVQRFFDGTKEQHGFFLELDRELRQFHRVTFVARCPPDFDFEFQAEVVQIFPSAGGTGTAFQLLWRPGKSEELHGKLHHGTAAS